MTGGGALGDLPAHAPRLSTVSEAKMKTNNFFICAPRFGFHRKKSTSRACGVTSAEKPHLRVDFQQARKLHGIIVPREVSRYVLQHALAHALCDKAWVQGDVR